MRAVVYISLMLILSIGCDSYMKKVDIRNFNANYHESLSFFDSSLISIFPAFVNTLPAIQIGYVHFAYEYYRYSGIILEVPYSDSLALKLINSNHVAVYPSFDSNLLIVGRLGESTIEHYRKFEKLYPWENSNGYIPVPNFYDRNYPDGTYLVDKDPLNNRLPLGYTLYIVDASPGIFIKKEWLTEGLGLPAKWKNGYSRGYALSSDTTKSIIYWLVIW